jgi:hypothetical protein
MSPGHLPALAMPSFAPASQAYRLGRCLFPAA